MMLASLVVTMEADAMRKQPSPQNESLAYHYVEYDWGDTILGSKEALRKMGIGQGVAFPAGRRRFVKTKDPRGFPCRITEAPGINPAFPYMAQIYHPGRETPDFYYWEVLPGLAYTPGCPWDKFVGSRETLLYSGLIQTDVFPGDPGKNGRSMTHFPDGSVPEAWIKPGCKGWLAGSKFIQKVNGGRFFVWTEAEPELAVQYQEAVNKQRAEYEVRIAALPRAPRIDLELQEEWNKIVRSRREGLRLVWSKPEFEPGLNPLPDGPYRSK